MDRFLFIFLLALFGSSCGSANSNTAVIKGTSFFTVEIEDPFVSIENGVSTGRIVVSNRGDGELNFDLEKPTSFALKRDGSASDIDVLFGTKTVILPPGESKTLGLQLEGGAADSGAYVLSLFATERDAEDLPISADVSFDAVFDVADISPVEVRRCEQSAISQARENEIPVLYGLDGYFCFDLKRSDASIKSISVIFESLSTNPINLDEANAKYTSLSFADVDTHRVEFPFTRFVNAAPEDTFSLTLTLTGVDESATSTQTYSIQPKIVLNSLWLAFGLTQTVPELKATLTKIDADPDSTLKLFSKAVLNIYLYLRGEDQEGRINDAQKFLADVKKAEDDLVADALFFVIKGMADSFTGAIKGADGGGDFIESSVKNLEDGVELSPNDWVLRFLRGITLVNMGRGIKDDFFANLIYGENADTWIVAGETDLKLVVDAHTFASLTILDWPVYNDTKKPVPDEIVAEAKKGLNP